MIKLLREGYYRLIETAEQIKIIDLGGKNYAWVSAGEFGEILVSLHNTFETDYTLAVGKFRIYDVKDESGLTSLMHLELFVGFGEWQGYLLTGGLPTSQSIRKRIVPTREIITRSTI